MSSFAPSAKAAQAALGGSMSLVQRPHPRGEAGVKISLEEVAAKIREGRLDPRVRGWAGRALLAAGRPKSPVGQARALLAALRKQTMYMPDPVDAEFIASAKHTLCLDDHGLCLVGADCDDMCVALGSALLSVGIPTKIVGQGFDASGVPSHVILAMESSNGVWKRIDPSSDTYDVGEFFPATKERWIDPLEPSAGNGLAGGASTMGDYIGVGRILPQVIVSTDEVQDLKVRLNAKIVALDLLVAGCPRLAIDKAVAWKLFVASWGAFYESQVPFFSTASALEIVRIYERDVVAWQHILSECGFVGPDFASSKPEETSFEKLGSAWIGMLRTVAIAAGVVGAAYLLAPAVSAAASRLRSKKK